MFGLRPYQFIPRFIGEGQIYPNAMGSHELIELIELSIPGRSPRPILLTLVITPYMHGGSRLLGDIPNSRSRLADTSLGWALL
jgi:hypothetical protein